MGKTSAAVKDRYNAKVYEEIKLRVRKGRKAKLKSIADAQGQSVNSFIVTAIDERVERLDGSNGKEGSNNAHAWREFFDAVNASNEQIPDTFERVNFAREVKL